MVVVLGQREQVWVDQEASLVRVEGGEHLADVWNQDIALVEHSLFLPQQRAVGDGGVDVGSGLVVQAQHVALGEIVQEPRSEEGEEGRDAAEAGLQGQVLACQHAVEQDLRHNEQAGPRRGVGEDLHP